MVRGTLKPIAFCNGSDNQECKWTMRAGDGGLTTRELQARITKHAQLYPGHSVVMEVTVRTIYWVKAPVKET